MLAELRIENLLLIERAELRLHAGLNVITGETGAGKTLLAHALDLLLGGKPRRGILRPGASEAYVEGTFEAPAELAAAPELAHLADRIPLDGGDVVLARRVTGDGRTRAYLQGRSATAADLRAVGELLVSFYGQHEHRRLALASAQLDVLDGFCGKEHLERRSQFERLLASARSIESELHAVRERAGARERDLDLIEFELGEIEAAAPEEHEQAELEAERGRLAAVETLRRASGAAAMALDRSDGEAAVPGAADALAGAAAELESAGGADPQLDALAERCRGLLYEARDLAAEVERYASSLEADPARLAWVEERLDLLGRLQRKHGGTMAAVLEHAAWCRGERDRLANSEQEGEELQARLDSAASELERLADELAAARRSAASDLEQAMRSELAGLAMPDATFRADVTERPVTEEGPLAGFGPRGADRVELALSTNPGVAPGPIREIASGGELSRVMLALMGLASAAEGAATVVFDEVDAGVGGNTAKAVGARLRDLASRRQVLCITHLPQVASLADRHFRVTKHSGSKPALADVEAVEGSEVVAELCRMLGADAGDVAARRHAERLRQAA